MNGETLWNKVISSLSASEKEVQTINGFLVWCFISRRKRIFDKAINR